MKILFRIFLFVLAIMALDSYYARENEAPVYSGKLDYHKVELAGGSRYFGLPADVPLVQESPSKGVVDYGNCHIEYGENMAKPSVTVAGLEMEEDTDDGVKKMSYFSEEGLVAYGAYVVNANIGFWSDANCAPKLEEIMATFTEKPVYLNDDFGFKLPLLDGFEVVTMPADEGVILKKKASPKAEQNFNAGRKGPENVAEYDVVIAFWGARNAADYQVIGDFVNEKFAGYTAEFADLSVGTGVFVDEIVGEEATRHFFALSEDKQVFYEGYLKLSKLNYLYHKEGFDSFVKTIEFF